MGGKQGKKDAPEQVSRDTNFDPKLECQENATNYVLRVALPGFKRDDFRVQVDGAGKLTIRGQRLASRGYIRFDKTFQLPSTANLDEITGRLEGNVLSLTVPKLPPPPAQAEEEIKEHDAKPKEEVKKTEETEEEEAKTSKQEKLTQKKEEEQPKAKARPSEKVKEEEDDLKPKDEGKKEEEKPKAEARPSEKVKEEDDLKPKDQGKKEDEKPKAEARPRDKVKEEEDDMKLKDEGKKKEAKPKAATKPSDEVKEEECAVKPKDEGNVDMVNRMIDEAKERVRKAKAEEEGGERERSCWKETCEGLPDFKWADGLVQMISNNKEVIITAIAAFTLGVFLSRKLL